MEIYRKKLSPILLTAGGCHDIIISNNAAAFSCCVAVYPIRSDSMAYTVSPSTTIGEMLEHSIAVEYVLESIGMFCYGCPSSQYETIEEAARVHGLTTDELVQRLNEAIEKECAE